MSLELKNKKWSIGFSYAWEGIVQVVKLERNFQIHLITALLVIIAGFILGLSRMEWIFIVIAIGIVLIAEMINSTIERIMDYIKPDIHPAAKQIKDMAAGGVLIAAVAAFIIGLFIFIPNIIALF